MTVKILETINKDNNHGTTILLLDNGQVHGMDLVNMVDGVLKD